MIIVFEPGCAQSRTKSPVYRANSASGARAQEARTVEWPSEYRDVLVQTINSEFESLPDDPSSLDRLLEVLVAYREFREHYGDDERVVDHVRFLENRLFFWDQETGFGPLAMHKGHPLLVLPARTNGRIRYSQNKTYFAMMPLAGLTRFKIRQGDEPTAAGTGVPNISGPRLTRTVPEDLTMASQDEIDNLHEVARARDAARGSSWSTQDIAAAALVAGGSLALIGWLNSPSRSEPSSPSSDDRERLPCRLQDWRGAIVTKKDPGDKYDEPQVDYECYSTDFPSGDGAKRSMRLKREEGLWYDTAAFNDLNPGKESYKDVPELYCCPAL